MSITRIDLATDQTTQLPWIVAMRLLCLLTGKSVSDVWHALERGKVIETRYASFRLAAS